MGSSDHDTDGLTIEPLASQARENADAKKDRIQGVASGYDMRDGMAVRGSTRRITHNVLKPAVPYWK